MSTARMTAIACAALVTACGGTVKFGDGGDDTHVEDTASDTASDPQVDEGEDVPGDALPDGVEDTLEPDLTPGCISMGCIMQPDGGPPCCEALDYVASCPPWDPGCTPIYHCADCGNGTCDPHETPFNCLSDCSEGCDVGATVGYACSPLEGYSCTCEEPPCRVSCEMTMSGFQWQNTCTEENYRPCSPTDDAECRHIGTAEEGWYSIGVMGSETLIAPMPCASHWMCYGYD